MNPPATVYVIDDEEAVRVSLGKLLRALGVPTEIFPSAEAFLESYAGDRRGCLLVDIRMPGMSGLDLIQELARRNTALPAIVMTGHTDMKSLHRLESIQPIGFLEKPFSVGQLKAMLERWESMVGGPSPS